MTPFLSKRDITTQKMKVGKVQSWLFLEVADKDSQVFAKGLNVSVVSHIVLVLFIVISGQWPICQVLINKNGFIGFKHQMCIKISMWWTVRHGTVASGQVLYRNNYLEFNCHQILHHLLIWNKRWLNCGLHKWSIFVLDSNITSVQIFEDRKEETTYLIHLNFIYRSNNCT